MSNATEKTLSRMKGTISYVTGTNPAAGSEISQTVPAGVRWKLKSVRFVLVTSATVANRFVNFIVDDGTTNIFDVYYPTAHTASLTVAYYAAPLGVTQTGLLGPATNRIYFNIPADMELLPGYRIRTTTTGIDAGDDFAAPTMYVEVLPI